MQSQRTKKQIVILLRWLLVMLVMTLLFIGKGPENWTVLRGTIALGFILSNIGLLFVPDRIFRRPSFDYLILGVDTAFISLAIYLSRETDLYVVYFLAILFAALGRNIKASVFIAFLASGAYLYLMYALQDRSIWETSILLRIPFFFVIALFAGFLAEESTVQRDRLRRSQYLLELGERVNATVSLREMAEALTQLTARVGVADWVAVFFRRGDGDCLEAFWRGSDRDSPPPPERALLPASCVDAAHRVMQSEAQTTHATEPSGWIPLQGEAMADLRETLGLDRSVGGAAGLYPMISRFQPVGYCLFGKRAGRTFQPEEREILTLAARQLAAAVGNAHLFQEMGQHVVEIATLMQISRAINSTLDLRTVFQRVMEETKRALRVEACSLLLLDDLTGELVFEVALGEKGDQVKEVRLREGEGIAWWVFREGKSVQVSDVSKDPRFFAQVDKKTQFVTHSIMASPLMVRGQVVGVIEAINRQGSETFSTRDVEFLESIASQAAVAVENAKLYQGVEREKSKVESILDSMRAGVVVVDGNNDLAFLNRSARLALGLTLRDLDAWPTHPPMAQVLSLLRRTLKEGEGLQEKLGGAKEGDAVYHLRTSLLRGFAGELLGAVAVLEEITEIEALSRLKSEFVSHVSHELRTPLTSVKGAIKQILRGMAGEVSDRQRRLLEIVLQNADLLIALINDLLDLSRLESGRVPMRMEEVDLGALIKECVATVEDLARDKGLELINSVPPEGLRVTCDRDYLKHVLMNLLSNAIKFTPSGPAADGRARLPRSEQRSGTEPDGQGATGRIALEARKAGGMIEVSVQDSGIGIPERERERIFEKFHRVENPLTATTQGTGLGLAICKRIVEGHGGQIWVEGEEGKGSRFIFALPLDQSARERRESLGTA
jgi:two-component system phosphate regulon sensor histidine kinase PhoR